MGLKGCLFQLQKQEEEKEEEVCVKKKEEEEKEEEEERLFRNVAAFNIKHEALFHF